MFQIVLSLIAGILIGWNFHLFYMALEPKRCMENNQTIISKLINQPKIITIKSISSNKIQKETNITKDINSSTTKSNFEKLLNSGNFSDAMAFYLEADEKQIKEYKLILKVYFYDNFDKQPKKTIEEIKQYIELEPKSEDFKLYLTKIYREKKEFQKALDILFELKNTQNSKVIDSDLNITIENYVKHLENSKNFEKLISFFEEMINKNIDNEKYIIRLAKLYNQLDNYEESKKLLEEITDDSIYNTNAQTILKSIEQKEKELQHYTHIIPLKKVGSQYSINLTNMKETGRYATVQAERRAGTRKHHFYGLGVIDKRDLRYIAFSASIWLSWLVYSFLYFWAGYYFMTIKGYTLGQWSIVLLATLIMAMIGGITAGSIMDRIGRKPA
ncbi:MAG TPA: hypothetical protein ENK99_01930, partial [Campylobacterales bacterium]|nr:hypothetical protein [Campylobacterales bacterium]